VSLNFWKVAVSLTSDWLLNGTFGPSVDFHRQPVVIAQVFVMFGEDVDVLMQQINDLLTLLLSKKIREGLDERIQMLETFSALSNSFGIDTDRLSPPNEFISS